MAGIEEQFILLGIGWVFIFIRVYVRWRLVGPRSFELDDYLMPVVGVSVPDSPAFQSSGPLNGICSRVGTMQVD